MKSRWKIFAICLVLVAAVLLEPVSYARADETTEEDAYNRTITVPRLNSSEIEFEKKEFFDWFGLKSIPEENVIEKFILRHVVLENVDYTLYDLVCDFELKTMGSGDEIITSNYSFTLESDVIGNSLVESIFNYFTKDMTVVNTYNPFTGVANHEFDYRDIVKNAKGFDEYDVTHSDKKGHYTYNTVISQADFYFVRKSDGEIGEARRFIFTWNEDFWLQLCTGIQFSWYNKELDYEKVIDTVENENGLDGYGLGEDGYIKQLLTLVVDVPAAIIAFVTNFGYSLSNMSSLFQVVFPFIPGTIIDVFFVFVLIFLLFAVFRMIG